jgi:ech hydrogenase subunit B
MNMNDILLAVLVIFVAPIIGCLYAGIDRIITARLQGRVGPLLPFCLRVPEAYY